MEVGNKVILGCKLTCTCSSSPEQYDVYWDDDEIGYLRLRHGCFYADYIECGGYRAYSSESMSGDGSFDDDEREEFLTRAVLALKDTHRLADSLASNGE